MRFGRVDDGSFVGDQWVTDVLGQQRGVSPGKRSLTMSLPQPDGDTAAAGPMGPVQQKRDPAADAVQRKAAAETKRWMDVAMRPDLNEAPVQRQAASDSGLGEAADQPLPSSGGGKAMPKAVQAKMENAFGTDFSAVRIHEGPRAAAVGALAYTQGADIHFAPGHYQPQSQSGQELLGHELTHVVQQSQGRVQTTTQAKGVGLNDDAALEREADELGAKAARGESVGSGGGSSIGKGGTVIQRKIQGEQNFANGKLSIDMREGPRESCQDAYGEGGLIRFDPSAQGHEASRIELDQTVQVIEGNKDKAWKGNEALREAWKSKSGRFVDALAETRKPAWETGEPVSTAYNGENPKDLLSGPQHDHRKLDCKPGLHVGQKLQSTELFDHPSFTTGATFDFETEVVATTEQGKASWGTVAWGFTTVAKPKQYGEVDWAVTKERLQFKNNASSEHHAAKARFNEVMGNTGPLSPGNISEIRSLIANKKTRDKGRKRIRQVEDRAKQILDQLPKDDGGWSKRLMKVVTGLQQELIELEQPSKNKKANKEASDIWEDSDKKPSMNNNQVLDSWEQWDDEDKSEKKPKETNNMNNNQVLDSWEQWDDEDESEKKPKETNNMSNNQVLDSWEQWDDEDEKKN